MAKTSGNQKRFQPRDVLKQVMIQDLAVSPDETSVVYTRRTIEEGKYRSRLWRVSIEGGRPEQLTTSASFDSRPRFSPNGRSLLFLSDRSGKSQPWIMAFSGGEPRRAAETDGDVSAAEWSPDGRRIALVAPSGEDRFITGKSSDPTARRITGLNWKLDGHGIRDQFNSAWILSLTSTKPKRVVEGSFEVSQVLWSPDGKSLGFLADLRSDADLLEEPQAWSAPLDGGKPERLAELKGAIFHASWSPRGQLVVVGVDQARTPEWGNIAAFLVEDDGVAPLLEHFDFPLCNTSYGDLIDPNSFISPLGWIDDQSFVAVVGEHGRSLPYRLSIDGSITRLAEGDIVCSSIAARGERVAVVATDKGRAAEVYAVEDGELRPLTANGSRWLEPFRKDPEFQRIRHEEGHDIDFWLVPARGRRTKRPLVVQIHGGPHASYSPTPWLEMLALADAGIHVLYGNPRGSTSYGEPYAKALHQAWGDPDGSDLLAMIDWAIDEGLTTPERVGVLGLSYGGYMVNWLLGHFPGRFAAGVSENPVTDMIGEYGESDFGTQVQETAVGVGSLPEDIDEFLRRSPYMEMHKNEAPLLLLQADQDMRCPPGQTELVFAMMRVRSRTVEMIRYPDESHYLVGMGRPDRRVDRMERVVAWFKRYL